MIILSVLRTAMDIVIGGYGADYAATYSEGDVDFLSTFASIFKSAFSIVSENPLLTAIVFVSVGVPIVGALVALFRGR